MMPFKSLVAATLFVCGAGLSALGHAQTIEINDGETVTLDLPMVPANQATIATGFFIDTRPNTTNLHVTLTDLSGVRDVDVLLKADEPFVNLTDINALFAEADYRSISPLGTEEVIAQDFATPSVHNRTWHIAVIAFDGAASQADLFVNDDNSPVPDSDFIIDFTNPGNRGDCDVAPWSDGTPFTPEGGNNATTLGQARRNAMEEAAAQFSSQLKSRIPVRIAACWRNEGVGDDGGATLASAGPTRIVAETPGLPVEDTFYVQAVFTRMAGTALCGIDSSRGCDEPAVNIFFNTAIDDPGGPAFYYGLTPASGSVAGADFIQVAMHEITHGLGFVDLLAQDGSLPMSSNGNTLTDAYTAQLATIVDGQPIRIDDPSLTDADRVAATTSFTDLLWRGPEASISVANNLNNFETGFVRMHAPSTFSPGSSVSHTSSAVCDLMNPNISRCNGVAVRELGLSGALMNAVGWQTGRNEPPYIGLMFDRARAGHGFEITLGGVDANGNNVYVLTFYSYETLFGSASEWFQAVGIVENGVFSGMRNGDGNGFPQFLFDDGQNPPQQADPGLFGQVALSFNNPTGSVACTDGENRAGASPLVAMQWVIDNLDGEWCMEPLAAATTRPATDFGGLWFAGINDQGWGFSVENIENPDGSITLFVLLYVYAADGTPVWFFGLEENVDLSQPVDLAMFQRTGFGRNRTFGNLNDEAAGTMTLNFVQPSMNLGDGNTVSVDVVYLGAEGGTWVRTDVPIQRLSLPRN